MGLRPARIGVLLLSINFVPAFARADTIMDALGDFTTADAIPNPGTGGQGLADSLQLGPFFHLSGRTRITEIGGFLNTCSNILINPDCDPAAFFVDIRRSFFGVPDLNNLLGTFALPLDPDPLTTTYLSVDPQLVLPAGDYFAIFRAADSSGDNFLLSSSEPGGLDPRLFADFTILGLILGPDRPADVTVLRAATRILGEPEPSLVPEPGSLILALSGLTLAAFARRNRC